MLIDQVDLTLDDFFIDPPHQGLFDLFASELPERVEVEQKGTRLINDNDTSSPPSSCPDDLSAKIREIEHLLMEDVGDGDEESSHTPLPPLSPSPPLVPVGVTDPKDSSGDSSNKGVDEEFKDDHSISKKQIRQLRNKDAALRSRERKKIYVKELEMKSQYMESECRRLGRLLQSCYAENHMLRLSLHTISLAPKAESAVLLLESLLLGSLLWLLLVKVCLLPPRCQQVVPTRELEVQLQNVNARSLEYLAEGNGGSELLIQIRASWGSILSKSCRASRTKMKMPALGLGVLFHIFG